MSRKRTVLFALLVLILSSLACNAFAGNEEPGAGELPPPPTTVIDTAVPEETPEPAPTATNAGIEETAVPNEGGASVTTKVDLNVRSGPGTQYDRISFLQEGESARVLGVDAATGWYKIECPARTNAQECWVSGSEQYVTSSNTGGVPAAVVPPTPTPEPLPITVGNMVIGGSTGLLVFVDQDGLWGVGLDLSQSPPLPGEPVRLVSSPDVRMPQIAPDGAHVAYLIETSEADALHAVTSDGETEQTLITSADLVIQGEGDSSNLAALVGIYQWLPDSQRIGFNTDVVNLVGPGAGSQEDWWMVELDADAPPDGPVGPGGGRFALAADTVIFARGSSIERGLVDNPARENVIPFDFINTASEYTYYPQPQWTAVGDVAYLPIPDADPWTDGTGAALWRVPADGSAEELGRLEGNILFTPVIWSPDGSRLAYLDSESPPTLNLADGDGQNGLAVDSDPRLAFHAWSPDGSRFLYSTQTEFVIGQPDGTQTTLPIAAGQEVAGAWWVTDEVLLTAVGDVGNWGLVAYNLAGESTAVTTISHDFVQVDLWVP